MPGSELGWVRGWVGGGGGEGASAQCAAVLQGGDGDGGVDLLPMEPVSKRSAICTFCAWCVAMSFGFARMMCTAAAARLS